MIWAISNDWRFAAMGILFLWIVAAIVNGINDSTKWRKK